MAEKSCILQTVLHFTKCFAFYMQVFVSPAVFFVNDIVYNFAHSVEAYSSSMLV